MRVKPSSPKFPKVIGWNTNDVLRVPNERPEEAFANAFLEVVQPDMMAEYDAVRLREKLFSLKRQGINFSPEFEASSGLWFSDEQNHFKGFNRLCAFILGKSETLQQEELAHGQSNFDKLGRFFQDELSISVIIAYDELVTTRSYAEDQWLYGYLGQEPLEWFKLVIKDEANHLYNFVQNIRRNFPHRLEEAIDLVDLLVKIDLSGPMYERTFVMDRRSSSFDRNTVVSAGNRLVSMLS